MRREAPDFYLGHVLPSHDPVGDPACMERKWKMYRNIHKGCKH